MLQISVQERMSDPCLHREREIYKRERERELKLSEVTKLTDH